VNFDFSADQKALGEAARRFLADRCTSDVVHSAYDSETGFSADLWKGLADLGVLGAAVPEAYGGVGLGRLELCVLAEEIGRALAPAPFTSSSGLFAELVLTLGDEAQKVRVLPGVADGSIIGVLATRDDPAAPVRRSGAQVSGGKTTVVDGAAATHALVSVGEGEALDLVLVDLEVSGVVREACATLDPTRRVARLTFDAAAAEPLGEPGQVAAVVRRALDGAAVLTAFEQLGGAERALWAARDFALQRTAFGRPIGSFQAIKHKLADMFVAATLARSNCYYGAWALASGSDELPVAAATARVSATQAFRRCASESLQVHGGMGFTWAADCHLLYRRANHLALALGSPGEWEDRLVRLLDQQAGREG